MSEGFVLCPQSTSQTPPRTRHLSYSTMKLPPPGAQSFNGGLFPKGEQRVRNSRSLESLRSVLGQVRLTKEKQEVLLTQLVSMHCQLKANHSLAISTIHTQKTNLISEIELLTEEIIERLNHELTQKEAELDRKKAQVKEFLEDLAETSDKIHSSAKYTVYTDKHENIKSQAKRLLARERTENDIPPRWLDFQSEFPYKIIKKPGTSIADLEEFSSIDHGRNETTSILEQDKPDESDKQAAISFLFNAYKNLEEKVDHFAHSYQVERQGPFSLPVSPQNMHRRPEKTVRIALSSRLMWKGTKSKLKANQIRLFVPSAGGYTNYYIVTLTPGVTSQEQLEHLVSHISMMGEHFVIGVKGKAGLVMVQAHESILKVKSLKHKQRFYLYKP